MRAAFDGVGPQLAVEANFLGSSPEQSEQRVCHRDEEEESVAPVRVLDVCCAQTPPKMQILGVSEGLFNRESARVCAGSA